MAGERKPRRCSPGCPPRRADGSISTSMISLCLLCWNTGWRIPIGRGSPTIDEWIAKYAPTQAPGGGK